MSDMSTRSQASAEWVSARLRDMIVKGELPPGARIVERRISADLKVSRTPVREALKLLHADGLIEISMHRGAQVTHYTEKEARELFDLAAVIEGLAAERLSERMTPAVLDRLEDLHARMLDFHATGDAPSYFDVNTSIHDLIVQEAGNPILAESHARIMIRARRGRFMAIFDAGRWSQAVQQHETVMSAFRDGDATKAGTVWRAHLRDTGTTMAEVLHRADG